MIPTALFQKRGLEMIYNFVPAIGTDMDTGPFYLYIYVGNITDENSYIAEDLQSRVYNKLIEERVL
ncbi:MAG: hypothetical protein AB1779_03140 [Candidatus Thermoplasmatota archaeon]